MAAAARNGCRGKAFFLQLRHIPGYLLTAYINQRIAVFKAKSFAKQAQITLVRLPGICRKASSTVKYSKKSCILPVIKIPYIKKNNATAPFFLAFYCCSRLSGCIIVMFAAGEIVEMACL